MSKKILVAPSILSADFSRLGEDIRDIERGGADLIHVDVMDGRFVPNITIGPCVIKSARKVTKLPFDVHLMIEEPLKYVKDFRDAGSDWITIHSEATRDIGKTLEEIKRLGAKAGISIKPGTENEEIKPFLEKVDLVLVMTVEPGFGGQSFMPEMVRKVKELRPIYGGMISVDGGVNAENAKLCAEAGADILVAGSYVFKQKDRKKAIESLR